MLGMSKNEEEARVLWRCKTTIFNPIHFGAKGEHKEEETDENHVVDKN